MAIPRALVLGGTSGIGAGVAQCLASAGHGVSIVGRSQKRGDEVVARMVEANKNLPASTHEFVPCDLSSTKSTADVVRAVANKHGRLDVLSLSQGIATTQGRTPTSEGLDVKMSLHYFSRIAAIRAALPFLQRSDDPRVLTVLSAGVHSYYNMDDDFELVNNYSLLNAANAAGTYNDLAVDALARTHPSITFVHASPGFVNTNWGTELPLILKGFTRAFQVFGRSPDTCAKYMCEPLLRDPKPPAGVAVMIDQNAKPASTLKQHTPELADRCLDETYRLLHRIQED